MATYTSNINLKKPAQSDKIRIADFNGNADNIDAAIGADFGQGTKPSINQAINSLADGLAIIANGNVHAAVTEGQFVYVRGHDTLAEGLYVASSNISANGTLSGSNLTADNSGGLNALNSKLTSIGVRSVRVDYPATFDANATYNTNLKTIIDADLPEGTKCIGIVGYDSGASTIVIVQLRYFAGNYSLQARNIGSAQSNKTAIVHYLYINS